MSELDIRKEQCQKDIAKLQGELKEIEEKIEKEKNPKWIAATGLGDSRLILNVPALSKYAKEQLKRAINDDYVISFYENGCFGTSGSSLNDVPLNFYDNTKIVFGEDA